jgi:hypothetical protein
MNGTLPMAMMSAGGKGIGLNFDHVLAKLQVSDQRRDLNNIIRGRLTCPI